MDLLTKSPGLYHVAENIFVNLDHKVLLLKCQEVNSHWKTLVRNPWLWFLKCEQKNQLKETSEGNFIRKLLQEFNNSDFSNEITVELMKICSGSNFYQNPTDKFIHGFVYNKYIAAIINGWTERVKLLAPLFDDPNSIAKYFEDNCTQIMPWEENRTPIEYAALKGHVDIIEILLALIDPLKSKVGCFFKLNYKIALFAAIKGGHTEIVSILAPLSGVPNAPINKERTQILAAAEGGHTDIVKFLAPRCGTPDQGKYYFAPNAPDDKGRTPILAAAEGGHTEIVKILAPLSGTPNAPNQKGDTPIHAAARFGHIEIVKILSPLANNLNTSNSNGFTPIILAAQSGHSEIV